MRVYDITRELLSAPLYPGDPPARLSRISDLELGDSCTTSRMDACLHSGTHIDAPSHYLPDGATVDQLAPDCFLGECTVAAFDGVMTGQQAEQLLDAGYRPRLLLKGNTVLSPSAAFVLSDAGLLLLGVEGTSVSDASQTVEVHRQLLQNGVVLLEGLDLSEVKPGTYYLLGAPLKVAGAEASFVRALLLERETIDWHEHFWK